MGTKGNLNMLNVAVTTTEKEFIIKFNGCTHLRLDRRELLGYQAYILTLAGQHHIQFYNRSGQEIVVEYDDIHKWKQVLEELDKVTLFYDE